MNLVSNNHLRVVIGVAILLVVSELITNSTIAQETLENRELIKPSMNYEKRIELAKKLLEPIRKTAISDPNSIERKNFFTEHWAAIDPTWTANFILNNPVPQPNAGQGRLLYDNKAIQKLLARPMEIDEKVLLKLLESEQESFLGAQYAVIAVENLSDEKQELKEKIIALATKDRKTEWPLSPMFFGNLLKISKMSSDPTVLERAEAKIADFYKSGDAEKMWEEMKKQQHFHTNKEYYQSTFTRYAPDSHQGKFGNKPNSVSPVDIFVLVHDETLSRTEKQEKLQKVKSFRFGKQHHEHFLAASSLGMIATIDHELAFQWADEAPAEHVKVWAKLAIAPAMSEREPALAKELVKNCYQPILQLDSSSRNMYNYNGSPTEIAASGLRIVEHVDPSLLPEAIDTAIETLSALDQSQMNSKIDHTFHLIAAVASYDREKAKKLFEKYADDVPIGHSASFFRALVALHPSHVVDEISEMPEKDDRGIDFRIYVRNEILPALTQRSDAAFWDRLNDSIWFRLDSKIFD